MSRTRNLCLGLFLIVGLSACTLKENLSDVSEGSVTPSFQPQPSETRTPAAPTETIQPTKTFTPFLPSTQTPMPSPSPTKLSCWSEGGIIEKREIPSNWLPDPLQFRVYTPPCYDQQNERRYPVLYLIHGQTYTDDQWDRLGADETADALIASGELSPFIIVMPREKERSTPPPANLFGDALIYDLIPRIDSDYRTLPDRYFRAIGGLSRGGNWAVHLGLSYWGFFGRIGAHSTPTFVTDGPQVIREWLSEIPAEELPGIFMDAGEDDIWLSYTLQFEEILNQEDIPHEWYLFPGQHNEEYWSAHLEQYLRWYAQDW